MNAFRQTSSSDYHIRGLPLSFPLYPDQGGTAFQEDEHDRMTGLGGHNRRATRLPSVELGGQLLIC
jgi:hypothetical protein